MLINQHSQIFRNLSEYQKESINKFLADPRIAYKKVRYCDLCGTEGGEIIALRDQFSLPCETTVCDRCGLIYTSNRLTLAATSVFYSEYYRKIYEGVPGPTLEHPFYKKLYSGWVPAIPAFVKRNWLVAEVGCGGGWNLLPYKDRGITSIGWDYDSNMVSFGRERFNLNLKLGGIEEFLATNIKCDYLILSQVLEHTVDPVEFLKRAKEVVTEDGFVCIYVPSLEYAEFFGGSATSWDLQAILQNAHNYLFCQSTLEAVILKADLTPVIVAGGYALVKAKSSASPKLFTQSFDPYVLDRISRIQKRAHFKSKIYGHAPHIVRSVLLDKLYHYFNPTLTLRRVLIEKFGII